MSLSFSAFEPMILLNQYSKSHFLSPLQNIIYHGVQPFQISIPSGSPSPDTLFCCLPVPHMAKPQPFPGVNSQYIFYSKSLSLVFRELTTFTSFLCPISPHYRNFPEQLHKIHGSNPYYTVPCFRFFSPTVINSVNIKYLPACLLLFISLASHLQCELYTRDIPSCSGSCIHICAWYAIGTHCIFAEQMKY